MNFTFHIKSCKVNSVQEACAKCFLVHILKFEILQITWKKWNKKNQTLSFHFLPQDSSFWCVFFFVLFLCGLQDLDFNRWTAKHLAQASCTELSLYNFGYQWKMAKTQKSSDEKFGPLVWYSSRKKNWTSLVDFGLDKWL